MHLSKCRLFLLSGNLHWLDKTDPVHLVGYYGSSLTLDCRLSSTDVNVTFSFFNLANYRWMTITPDGNSFKKIGNQQLKISKLGGNHGTEYACNAPGVSERKIVVILNSSK